MDRSERYGFNTALLYINIDQFANINDHYGEADGDQMIQTISNRLLNKLRSTLALPGWVGMNLPSYWRMSATRPTSGRLRKKC